MKILVLQHIAIEDPGYIKDLIEADGHELVPIELDEGDAIPADLAAYDAMLCMGGPMDTWMEDDYPWLVDEKRAIREWVVEREKPFLGFCLGCQLLGEVIGGQVVKSEPPEIGVLDIQMTPAARGDALFGDFPATIKAVQWHSCEVRGLEFNTDVTLLGSSPTTRYQIFSYREHAWGIQFHVEVRADTVRAWGEVPEYRAALETSLGPDALAAFDADAQQHMAEMNRLAKLLYDNFKRLSQARAEAQHPHPARQRRIEQVIVPVGRLEQRIVRIERDHVEIELVGDALLGELEAALAGLDQRVAERRLEAEQRGQVVDELVFLVIVALGQQAQAVFQPLARIGRLAHDVAQFLRARLGIAAHDQKVHAALLVAAVDRIDAGGHAVGRAAAELAHAELAQAALPRQEALVLFVEVHSLVTSPLAVRITDTIPVWRAARESSPVPSRRYHRRLMLADLAVRNYRKIDTYPPAGRPIRRRSARRSGA